MFFSTPYRSWLVHIPVGKTRPGRWLGTSSNEDEMAVPCRIGLAGNNGQLGSGHRDGSSG